jgi:hypothetical protein
MGLKILSAGSAFIICAGLIILLSFVNKYHFPFIATAMVSHNSHPLVGTFYYPWYSGNERGYEGWTTGGSNPPYNWASHFIPYFGSSKFDPVHQLYDSGNVSVLKRQLAWMKQAGIQFAISSWDDINGTRDRVFSEILDYMVQNKTNPYPDFRWSLLYEKAGYRNLTTDQVIHDFGYMKSKYASSPSYLKVDGRPVVFVYNVGLSKGSFLNNNLNWSTIKNQTGFYMVMQNSIQNKGKDILKSIDAWYEYKPTTRYEEDYGYSAFVSPGYWKYNESPKLIRNTTDFENSVQKLASAKVHFKLIETWNEWFEGSQIEPGQQIAHDDKLNTNVPATTPYSDVYLRILGKYFSNHH